MTVVPQTSLFTRCAPGMVLALALCTVYGYSADTGAIATARPSTMPVTVERPNAGLSVTVPAGFEQLTLSAAGDIMRAVKVEREIVLGRERVVQSVVVRAFAVVESDTAESCADAHVTELSDARLNGQLHREVRVLGKAVMPVADSIGAGRLLSYIYRDVPCVSGQVFLVREVPPYGRLGYVISVEVEARFQPDLPRLLGEVLKGVKYLPFKHPCDVPMGILESPREGPEGAFSIRVPQGWYVLDMERGLRLGCTDYLRGGLPYPLVDVVSVELHEEQTAKQLVQRLIHKYNRLGTLDKTVGNVMQEGACRLDGVEGYQFVYRVVPQIPVLVAGQAVEPAELRVHRMVCVPTGRKGVVRNYALLMVLRSEDIPGALAMMDKLSEGFKIQQDASAALNADLPSTMKNGAASRAAETQPASRPQERSIFGPSETSIFAPTIGPASRPLPRATSAPASGLPK